MIREQSPETNLIVQAIYPVNEHMETLYARVMVGKRTMPVSQQSTKRSKPSRRRTAQSFLT